MRDTATVEFMVIDVAPVGGGWLLALANVELVVNGVVIELHGVQVNRCRHPQIGQGATAVELPRYRAPDGTWKPAVTLRPELHELLADAILERCCEQGITHCLA